MFRFENGRAPKLLGLVAGSVLMASSFALADEPSAMPSRTCAEAFDHLMWATPDLDLGIAWFEERTGVRAIVGGSHPGRGTRNALLSLGEGHYLEIVAPDPEQPESAQGEAAEIGKLESPLLIGWAVRSFDLERDVERFRAAGAVASEPRAGGRDRPDGRKLSWKTASAGGELAGILPFFIEWGKESQHPSIDAPAGGTVTELSIVHPDPEAVVAALDRLGLSCEVSKGESIELHARIMTPKGEFDL